MAGGPIAGTWWAHAHGKEIFAALNVVADSPDVRCFKLVGGKVTFVHRRLWPALVRLGDELGADRLAEVRQEHTPSGKHANTINPFPSWVPAEVKRAAAALSVEEARAALGPALTPPKPARSRTAKFGTGLRPTPENETGPAPSAAAVLAPRSARRQDVQLRLRWRPIGARSVVLLGAGKPFAKFDSGLYEHPRLLPGARVARSGARISDFPIRSPRRSHGGDHGPDA